MKIKVCGRCGKGLIGHHCPYCKAKEQRAERTKEYDKLMEEHKEKSKSR